MSYSDKLDICSRYLTLFSNKGELNIEFDSSSNKDYYTRELVTFLDAASNGLEGVSDIEELTVMGLAYTDWLK